MAVTLETIARRLGVSKVTVSLGLRGSPRISAGTREKIARAAAELGYTPNPMVSALMVSLRAARPAAGHAFNLCFLTAFPARQDWKRIPVFPRYFEGVRLRAAELGYGVETHWMGDAAGSGARMSDILRARGIPGVIVAPLPEHGLPLGLDWARFSVVALGRSFTETPAHHVANNQFHTITTALAACRDRGFRRVGFAIPQVVDDKTEHVWLSAYLGFLARHPALRKLAPLVTPGFNAGAFLAWFRKNRPDVVVTTHVPVLGWLREAGLSVPGDTAYVHLDYTPERGDFAGIDQRPEQLGAAAVELLVEQINQNRRGVPAVPKSVLIEGVWRDGPTCPPRAPAARPAERR